jgi:hypothetical protein
MNSRNRFSLFACLLVLSSLACAPDPKVIAKQTATDLKSIVREAWQTAETTNSWATLDSSFAAVGLRAGDRQAYLYVPAVTTLDQGTNAIDSRIERVFSDSNIVENGLGGIVFQVRGVDLCTDTSGALDSSCANSIDTLQLRVRATGNLDLTLLVGAEKTEAFTLEIRSGVSIAVTADIAKTVAAVTAIQTATSSTSTMFNVKATGRVEARLQKNGPGDFTLSTAVLTPLDYEMTGTDGVTRKASVGAKNPTMSVRIEQGARRATLKYGAGELRYSGLVRDVFGSEPTTRPMDAFLSGAEATLIFEDGKNARLENVGFGTLTSTVKAGNDLLLAFDFNKDQGRSTAATFEPTARGFKLSFTPGLQLNARLGLGVLENPNYTVSREYKNANYTASFLSAAGKNPTIEFLVRNTEQQSAFARLLEGTLQLAVNDALVSPLSFSAPACIGSAGGMVNNVFVESFVSAPCP